jgi:N-acyl-D-amino-acid deacylase
MNHLESNEVVLRALARFVWRCGVLAAALGIGSGAVWAATPRVYDVVIRNALIFDGSGGKPFLGEVAIDADRIAYVGAPRALKGHSEIDAHGQAVAPGFIDMMGHSEESLLVDGRGVSGLKQGITLDVFTEQSMGSLSDEMARQAVARQGDVKFDVTWRSRGQNLDHLQQRGIAPNVASFVGEGEVRVNVLGEGDVVPSPEHLTAMRALVRQAMEEGAMGLTTALIYAPMNYAKTQELIARAEESARCGGIYRTCVARPRLDRCAGRRLPRVEQGLDVDRSTAAPVMAACNAHDIAIMTVATPICPYVRGQTATEQCVPLNLRLQTHLC